MGVGSQDAAQMCLAQDDEMVHALAPDRSDQTFGLATRCSAALQNSVAAPILLFGPRLARGDGGDCPATVGGNERPASKGRFGRSHTHYRGSRHLSHTRVEPFMNVVALAGLVKRAAAARPINPGYRPEARRGVMYPSVAPSADIDLRKTYGPASPVAGPFFFVALTKGPQQRERRR
jgi:hypothetical protein